MNLDDKFRKWLDTKDIDALFGSTRLAIIVAQKKIKIVNQQLLDANRLYWQMKRNPSEKDKYNKVLDEIILPLESFISDHICFEGESYTDDFEVPSFDERRGKKKE